MKKFFIERFSRLSEQDIEVLENQLASVLKPIPPSSEFVTGLRAGLLNQKINTDIVSLSTSKISRSILVAGGVLGGLVMIIASIRGLISLFGIIGMLSQRISRNNHAAHSGQTTLA